MRKDGLWMRWVGAVAALLGTATGLAAAGILSAQSGDWDDASTWVGGSPPYGVQATIVPGHTVTVTDNSPPPLFYFWDEGDGGGIFEVDPASATPSTVSARGTNQKFEGTMNVREDAFVRFGNETGSSHFSLNGNAVLNVEGRTEWFTDNADSRIFLRDSSQMHITGEAGKVARFGEGAGAGFWGIYCFGNGNVLDAEYAAFDSNRAVFIHDGAVDPNINIRHSSFNGNTAQGGIVFNENANALIRIEDSTFDNQLVRSIFNRSRVELIDVTITDGKTLGDLVMFSGSTSSERWVASYAGDTSGDYLVILAEADTPVSYSAFELDPTLASDVKLRPDLAEFSPNDGNESSTGGSMMLVEDSHARTIEIADGVTLFLNGFDLCVNMEPDPDTLARIDTSSGGRLRFCPPRGSIVHVARAGPGRYLGGLIPEHAMAGASGIVLTGEQGGF